MKKPLTIGGKSTRLWAVVRDDGLISSDSGDRPRLFFDEHYATLCAIALRLSVIEVQVVPVESEEA